MLRGLAQFVPIARFSAKEHRARVDGRATARHLHGIIERTVRCHTVKVSAESPEQSRAPCSLSLCQPDKVADSHNLMVVLADLQGVVATFRVGRHHHRGPLHEGRGLTHALTHTAPTDLTVADATLLVAQAQSDRVLRLLCGRLAPVAAHTFALDALKRASRSPSLQPSRSTQSALSGCGRRW